MFWLRAGIMVSGLFLANAAAAAPPIAAYGKLPTIAGIEVSPDGTKWAAIVGDETRAEIQVRELASTKLLAATPVEKAKARSLMWAGNDHVIATVSTTADVPNLSGPRREWFMLVDFKVSERRWHRLLGGIEGAMNVATGRPKAIIVDGKPILVVPGLTFPSGHGTSTLFRINLETYSTKPAIVGTSDTIDWEIGDDAKPLARVDYDQKTGEWRLLLRDGDALKRVYSEVAPIDRPGLLALSNGGQSVLVSAVRSGKRQLFDVALPGGAWSAPRPESEGDGLIIDPVSHRLLGVRSTSLENVDYKFVDPADQALWRGLTAAFPGEIVSFASWSDDRKIVIVEVEGPTNGDAFFVVDRRAHTANWLVDRYPGVTADDIAPVRTLRYAAADGTEIPAYLTLPRGRPAKNLPLVVMPHGGPEARDKPGFDWWAQALASRGYAVLQPQFRGSAGFTTALRDAGYGQWGRKMQTDLSDGVRFLAREGTIDTKRVCIAGASYGGYAALAGPTLDPGIHRCASAFAGVADLRRMLAAQVQASGGTAENITLRYWKRFMGVASPGDRQLDAYSPALLAAKVNVPIQLIHGKDDTVVLYAQSTLMEKALLAAGKPVEMVTLPGEDHWLSRAPTRIAMLTAMLAFLEKHNPPDPVAAEARASNANAPPG